METSINTRKHIKLTAVGDRNSDKNKLIYYFETSDLNTEYATELEYVPTVNCNQDFDIYIEGHNFNLLIWDTSGQEEYTKLRKLSYPNTDIVVFVYSLIKPITLENIENVWYPEIKEHLPKVPCILVGVNRDLRDNFILYELENQAEEKDLGQIKTEMGQEMAIKINASYFFEIDFKDLPNLKKVFESACLSTIGYRENIEIIKQQKIIDESITRIGLYGDSKSGRIQFALKYIMNDDHEGKIPQNENDFLKIVEVNNILLKVTIKIMIENMNNINGMVFLFNISSPKSYDQLKNILTAFKSKYDVPFIVIANFGELRNSNVDNTLVPVEEYDDLKKQFGCFLFEINSNSYEDIEDTIFNLLKIISKRNLKEPQKKRKEKMIKKISKSHPKMFTKKKKKDKRKKSKQ